MKISIIVPVYKVLEYLPRCVNSLINQTYKNIEIILVDDGSPDECGKLCDDYKKKDNRIVVIHKKNGGLSDARNAGSAVMSGEYGLFVDSDDYIEENTCEELVKIILKTNADLVAFKKQFVYENSCDKYVDTNEVYEYNAKNAYIDALYGKNFEVTAWSRIYSKKTIDKVKFPVGVLSEDYATMHLFFFASSKIVFFDKTLYHYFIRKNGIMGTKSVKHMLDIYNISNDVYKFQLEMLPEHSRHIRSLYTNNLLKTFSGLTLSEKTDVSNAVLKECKNKIRAIKIKNMEIKTIIILILYKINKKATALIISKYVKDR